MGVRSKPYDIVSIVLDRRVRPDSLSEVLILLHLGPGLTCGSVRPFDLAAAAGGQSQTRVIDREPDVLVGQTDSDVLLARVAKVR